MSKVVKQILEQCKVVHCVDLGGSFQTHIYLQIFYWVFDTPGNEPSDICQVLPKARQEWRLGTSCTLPTTSLAWSTRFLLEMFMDVAFELVPNCNSAAQDLHCCNNSRLLTIHSCLGVSDGVFRGVQRASFRAQDMQYHRLRLIFLKRAVR